MWSCYCLQSSDGQRTYIGATLDVHRRLQQHNGQLSGGAKATRGRSWSRVCHISGFPSERAALQFEWAWKYKSKQYTGSPLKKRVLALLECFGCDQPTRQAHDFQSYVRSLQVVWEHSSDILYYLH